MRLDAHHLAGPADHHLQAERVGTLPREDPADVPHVVGWQFFPRSVGPGEEEGHVLGVVDAVQDELDQLRHV